MRYSGAPVREATGWLALLAAALFAGAVASVLLEMGMDSRDPRTLVAATGLLYGVAIAGVIRNHVRASGRDDAHPFLVTVLLLAISVVHGACLAAQALSQATSGRLPLAAGPSLRPVLAGLAVPLVVLPTMVAILHQRERGRGLAALATALFCGGLAGSVVGFVEKGGPLFAWPAGEICVIGLLASVAGVVEWFLPVAMAGAGSAFLGICRLPVRSVRRVLELVALASGARARAPLAGIVRILLFFGLAHVLSLSERPGVSWAGMTLALAGVLAMFNERRNVEKTPAKHAALSGALAALQIPLLLPVMLLRLDATFDLFENPIGAGWGDWARFTAQCLGDTVFAPLGLYGVRFSPIEIGPPWGRHVILGSRLVVMAALIVSGREILHATKPRQDAAEPEPRAEASRRPPRDRSHGARPERTLDTPTSSCDQLERPFGKGARHARVEELPRAERMALATVSDMLQAIANPRWQLHDVRLWAEEARRALHELVYVPCDSDVAERPGGEQAAAAREQPAGTVMPPAPAPPERAPAEALLEQLHSKDLQRVLRAIGIIPAKRKDERIRQVLACGRPLVAALSLLDVEILRSRFRGLELPETATPVECAAAIVASLGIVESSLSVGQGAVDAVGGAPPPEGLAGPDGAGAQGSDVGEAD